MNKLLLNLFSIGRWTVRVVPKGANYGLDDCLVHTKDDPLVEFHDRENLERFLPLGQFVSRYAMDTITNRGSYGLVLQGGVDAWTVSAEEMFIILNWLRYWRATHEDSSPV